MPVEQTNIFILEQEQEQGARIRITRGQRVGVHALLFSIECRQQSQQQSTIVTIATATPPPPPPIQPTAT